MTDGSTKANNLALEVWLDFLRLHDPRDDAAFEDLCQRHPELASTLGRLRKPEAHPPDTDASAEAFAIRLRELAKVLPVEQRMAREGLIARGGMGAVHRVRDLRLERTLALKEMARGSAETRPRASARFYEEAQITSQLDHPGIVPVHECGVDAEGRLYFAMKLVQGRDLREILELARNQEEGWTSARMLGVLLKVCDAMAYAHSKGVIHRDLKPGNIMVGSFGEVYVMDWGLARALGRPDLHDLRLCPGPQTESLHTLRRDEREETPDSPLVTLDGDVVGTPAYMAPEQARGEVHLLSPRSDVYSLGAVLYHILTGEMPYVPRGARLSAHTVLARVIGGPPPAIHLLQRDAPFELVAIADKAMAREPGARYADTLALGADLRAYLEDRVVRAHETGAVAELRKWITRNRGLAAAMGALALVLVVALVTSLVQQAESKRLAGLAEDNARIAKVNEARALSGEELAKKRADEVFRLSALQKLDDLTQEADQLWPAHPENLQAYEEWLGKARELLAELPDHERKLEELRARALPWTHAERDRQRARHPKLAELEAARRQFQHIEALRATLDLGETPEDPAPEAVGVDLASLPPDVMDIKELAYGMIEPGRRELGYEPKGLVLMRRAVELSAGLDPTTRAELLITLAWALFVNGRGAEAIAQADLAVAEVPNDQGLKARVQQLRQVIEEDPDPMEDRFQRGAELEQHISELEAEISIRTEWLFAEPHDRWWHGLQEELVEALRAFETELVSGGVPTRHGWTVEMRVEFARDIVERSVSGSAASEGWAQALASIADPVECPLYGGLRIPPQLGLLPLGRDPESGLWEFAHLGTGEPAQRRPDGRLILKEATGLVFVLLPAGTFVMGAQSKDPGGPNHDPEANPTENPPHEVSLSPFFLSKYEMTQGQWLRVLGTNPSRYGRHAQWTYLTQGTRQADLADPVEYVSWIDCHTVLTRLGLKLPSEAQWEYAARAGTTTVWWTGDEKLSLAGAANVSDAYAKANGAEAWGNHDLELNDGHAVHARVGTFRANAFGLHEMIGNVSEWCQDGHRLDSYYQARVTDPLSDPAGTTSRLFRGGGFSAPASSARSANRCFEPPDYAEVTLGLRPARGLDL